MKHSTTTAFRFGALAMVAGMLGCGGGMSAASPASTGASSGGWSGAGGAMATTSSGASYAGSAAPSAEAAPSASGGMMAPPPAMVSSGGRAAGAAGAPPRAPMAAVSAGGGGGGAVAAGGASSAPVTGAAVAAQPSTTVAVEQPQPAVGLLTAASVGDADRRGNYTEYLSRHVGEARGLDLDMTRRVRIRVVDAQQHPVHNARVVITDGAREMAAALTHADGYWDYYPTLWRSDAAGHVTARVQFGGNTAAAVIDVPARGDGQDVVVTLRQATAAAPRALELGFAIDVTGSMGDELRYVNREVASIVQRVRAASPNLEVRVGAVFYRDRTDYQPLQAIPFTADVGGFAGAMQQITASGGGDYPEDMNRGLEAAMRQLRWSSDAGTDRVLVVIADAPPQMYSDAQYTFHDAMREASQRGIRLLPVAASGADRTVEYLFRAMGAATSTPYVYLTDESGVGAPHMEADTDRVAVERFNDLLVRLVASDLRGEGMHEPGALSANGS